MRDHCAGAVAFVPQRVLCLVIVDRPEIKHCWENAAGVYSVELAFEQDSYSSSATSICRRYWSHEPSP